MTGIKEKIRLIQKNIQIPLGKEIKLMEVCGTHTMSIAANGIHSLLPEGIRLISGPGCPVCVTSQKDIESALILARKDNVLITTFGDMIRVPSGKDRLENYKNVHIVYSPMESLDLAMENPEKEVVFMGVGFETTAPLIASTITEADKRKIENFSTLCLHKTIPAALELILSSKDSEIDGLILPGHVSAVTGSAYYDFLQDQKTPGVITGFDGLNIMESIYLLTRMILESKTNILNNYTTVVNKKGNTDAMELLDIVFEPSDADWRGIGVIPGSGLKIRDQYKQFDALEKFPMDPLHIEEPKGCLCGLILMGKVTPPECRHFGTSCTPLRPVGPCMVSSEGTCAAWYKYGRGDKNSDR
ncbi:MAG: hydrogenase formation protein HypD [Spirochaetaceae bacterium]|nr:hydrogenase formation protein HypD [Spirochaetaceae bacterium]